MPLAACGGGGSESTTPPLAEQQVTLGAQASLDGLVGTLRLYQWNQVGDPYATHGVVVADHLDYGDTLDGDD